VTTGTGARGGFKSGVGLLLTMLGDFMADAGGWIYDDLNDVFLQRIDPELNERKNSIHLRRADDRGM
jgi:hypothetical protein